MDNLYASPLLPIPSKNLGKCGEEFLGSVFAGAAHGEKAGAEDTHNTSGLGEMLKTIFQSKVESF